MQGLSVSETNVDLLEKKRPQQQRAIKTYEAILSAAGSLLCEVGLERISTNNIAERAGVTVPALYRYFPNKYSVLNALGNRLLEAQRESFIQWFERCAQGRDVDATLDGIEDLLWDVYRTTRDFPGGLELMHGSQTMAPLQEVQQQSQWEIAEYMAKLWADLAQEPRSDAMINRARVLVSMGFMSIQMALEDKRMDPATALGEGARALRTYLENALIPSPGRTE